MAFVDNQVYQQRPDVAGGVERVMRRAKFLSEQDRVLFEMVCRGDTTYRHIATLMGISPSALTRRIQRLSRRLHDPLVIALVERPGNLRAEARQIGIEHFLQGIGAGELSEMHQMPRGQVLTMIGFLRGWFKGMQSAMLERSRAEAEE